MCTCFDVANYFLSLTEEDAGDVITNLKMQKLLYYAQGFALALFDKPLFDENFEAWQHGPVVPSVYHKYKQHGSNPLPKIENFSLNKYTIDEQNLLNQVFKEYGQFSAWKLRDMTHEEPPWKNTPLNGIIDKDKMRQYFITLVE